MRMFSELPTSPTILAHSLRRVGTHRIIASAMLTQSWAWVLVRVGQPPTTMYTSPTVSTLYTLFVSMRRSNWE